MAITHSVAIKNLIADNVASLVAEGAINLTASLVLYTSDDGVVSTMLMDAVPFAPSVDGIITANTILPDINTVGGTATKFSVLDLGNRIIFSGTVGKADADLILTDNIIPVAATLTINSLTYQPEP
ncbi:MAG: hypothetical protein MJH10_08630 [Epibacterium sp.]|nr:hypothetical protein [Epibacterium sp.]NQX73602.1 hypothetical protein [Epibacterium sp.]